MYTKAGFKLRPYTITESPLRVSPLCYQSQAGRAGMLLSLLVHYLRKIGVLLKGQGQSEDTNQHAWASF